MTAALGVDGAGDASQEIEHVRDPVTECNRIVAVTFQVIQHAAGTSERLSGSWKVHKPIVQEPAMWIEHPATTIV
jgi:hypothetical protein